MRLLRKRHNKESLLKRNPILCLSFVGMVALIVVYIISGAAIEASSIIEKFNSLDRRVVDSKAEFNKPTYYLYVNEQGNASMRIEIDCNKHKNNKQYMSAVPTIMYDLSATGEQVKSALLESRYKDRADLLALVYDVVEPIYGSNAAIGFMANIYHEGTFGIIETKFYNGWVSNEEPYCSCRFDNSYLSGQIISTMTDIEYMLTWDSNCTQKKVKGAHSCGVGMVQWSYNRRINLMNKYKEFMVEYGLSQLELEHRQTIEIAFFVEECKRYPSVRTSAEEFGNTPEAWAEAVCDIYESPANSCGDGKDMSYVKGYSTYGSSCRTRAATATDFYNIIKDKIGEE